MIYIPCYNVLTLPDVSCYFRLDYLYITVKMYPCSGGTDTGSPEL